MIISPADFCRNPVSMLRVVDLPAPFGPNKPNIVFFSTANVIPPSTVGPF